MMLKFTANQEWMQKMSNINYTPYTQVTENLTSNMVELKEALGVNIRIFNLTEEMVAETGNSDAILFQFSKGSNYLYLIVPKEEAEKPVDGFVKEALLNISQTLNSVTPDENHPVYYFDTQQGKIISLWPGTLLNPSDIGLQTLVEDILKIEQIENVEIKKFDHSDSISITCFIVGNDPDINFVLPQVVYQDSENFDAIINNITEILSKYNR